MWAISKETGWQGPESRYAAEWPCDGAIIMSPLHSSGWHDLLPSDNKISAINLRSNGHLAVARIRDISWIDKVVLRSTAVTPIMLSSMQPVIHTVWLHFCGCACTNCPFKASIFNSLNVETLFCSGRLLVCFWSRSTCEHLARQKQQSLEPVVSTRKQYTWTNK